MAERRIVVNSIVSAPMLRQSPGMRLTLRFALLGLLGACAPLSVYYKPGVEVTRLQTDTTTGQVSAARDVPPNTQIRQAPPVFYPGRSYCDGAGNCWHGNPYWVEGSVYTVDVNAGLRKRVTDQCMDAKGYAPVRIPLCPIGVTPPPGRTTRMPALTPNSCAVRNRDGSFQIVEVR